MSIQEEILNLITQKSKDDVDRCLSLFSLSENVELIKKEEITQMPFHLNLLETAIEGKMKETAHSRFLWQLLRIKKILEHFTNNFFNGIFSIKEKYRLNTPDKFRMDISLQTETDFYIIENKVNDAKEQCGQIFRYVQHALTKGFRPDHIYVLYLNSETHDAPSPYSTSKDGKEKVFIPKAVNITVVSYKEEVVNWLEEIYQEISVGEVYLKTAIFQYLDYLKEKYHISKRYSKMNSKIQSFIKEKLFTEDMDCLQRLNVISDTKHQIDQIQAILDKLEKKEKSSRFQEWFDQITLSYPVDDYQWVRDNEYDIHIEFIYHGYLLAACLTIDDRLCWGIKCIKNKPLPKKWAESLHSSVQLVLPRAQFADLWPAWDYTSYENGLERFLTLIRWVIENEDQE